MAAIPEAKTIIQAPSSQTRQPWGEYIAFALGGDANFLLTRNTQDPQFHANGLTTYWAGKSAVDGIWIADFNFSIVDVQVSIRSPGTGGQTILDILHSTNNGSTWNTIFSTTPKVDSSAGSYSFARSTDSVTGYTPAVLIGAPAAFNINAGDGLRMDVLSSMTGSPQDISIKLVTRTR